MIEDYKNKYLMLCENLYGVTKKEVKKHNKSMELLCELYHEISNDKELAEELLYDLMMENNEKVQVICASQCLGLNINVRMAKKTLKKISNKSCDSMVSLNAEMILHIYEEQGYIDF